MTNAMTETKTEIKIPFVLVKETPGALRYQECKPGGGTYSTPNEPGSRIGVLYIRKSTFEKDRLAPSTVEVTLTFDIR